MAVLEFAPTIDEEAEARREAVQKARDSIRQLTHGWVKLLEAAYDYKQDKFGNDAEEALRFFGSDHSFIWEKNPKSNAAKELQDNPGFSMTYNIVAELVQIFGPYIYHRNPDRQAKPVKPLEFPREAIVDPVVEYQIQSISTQLQEAVMQAAGPFVDAYMQNGMPPEQAQQQAMQQAMMLPQFTEVQQQLAELNQEYSSQVSQYDQMIATQKKSLAKKSAKSLIMERLLNYTPRELNLREHSRKVVDETLIKGMGTWWTELYQTEDGQTLVGSFFDSIDNYLSDPDSAEYEDSMWVARKRCEATWKAESKFDLPPGSIKGNASSRSKANSKKNDAAANNIWKPAVEQESSADSNDLVVYWEIWSKMGLGGRLKGMPPEVKDKFEDFGDYCYLVICEDCDYPLNMPPDAIFEKDSEELFADVSWPIPFHKDGEFPCTPLSFHWVPNCPYGMSHIKPAIGELKFLDFAMSHLARKMRTASTDIIGVIKGAGDDIKEALRDTTNAASGYKIVEIESHYGKNIAEMFSFAQVPPFNGDVWNVVTAVAARLDRRLGLNDRVFGMGGTESRSAADSKNKQAAFSIRPEDMANIVEERASILCRKEAMAIAWFMDKDDVAPIIGEEAAFLYDQLIYNQENPLDIVREYDYCIVANSIRRPSRETDQENFASLLQMALPAATQYGMQSNNYEPLNKLFRQADTIYLMDGGVQFTPIQPPQPSPEEMQAAQIQKDIAQLTLQAQLQQAKNIEAQSRLAELQVMTRNDIATIDVNKKQSLAEIELRKAISKMEQNIADAALQRRIDEEEHKQEMKQDQEAFEVTKRANEEGGGSAKMMSNYRRDYKGYR